MDRDKTLSLAIVDAGRSNIRQIEAYFCTPDGTWVYVIFDQHLARYVAAELNRLAGEL